MKEKRLDDFLFKILDLKEELILAESQMRQYQEENEYSEIVVPGYMYSGGFPCNYPELEIIQLKDAGGEAIDLIRKEKKDKKIRVSINGFHSIYSIEKKFFLTREVPIVENVKTIGYYERSKSIFDEGNVFRDFYYLKKNGEVGPW